MIAIVVAAFAAGLLVRATDLESMSAVVRGEPGRAALWSGSAWLCAVGGYALALETGSMLPLLADGIGYMAGAAIAARRARARRRNDW